MQAAISAHNGIAPPLGEAMDRESKRGGGAGEPSAGTEEKLSRRFSTANSTDAADDDEEEDGEKGEIVLGPQVALKEQLELDKVNGFVSFLPFILPVQNVSSLDYFSDDVSSLTGV